VGEDSHLRRLMHGVIMHGEQRMRPDLRALPTTYYSHSSGVGAALDSLAERPALRIGVIGLGVGTLAAYGRPGDVFRFYEINPQVIELAQGEFTYLKDSDAKIDLVLGDGRLQLEAERPQGYDLLAADAFSSDSVPMIW